MHWIASFGFHQVTMSPFAGTGSGPAVAVIIPTLSFQVHTAGLLYGAWYSNLAQDDPSWQSL